MSSGNRQGRVAVVTGASRRQGIGAAICRALAADGADIFFTHWSPYDGTMPCGIDEDGPAALEQELRGMGARCASREVDLSFAEAPIQILDEAEARLGRPALLVNNASHWTANSYEVLNAAILDAHYAVNIRGTLLLSVEFSRRFSGAAGRIINLTSGQGTGPMPGELAYVAGKGAIEAFTVSLAAEVAARGITVNAVDPGPIDSGWMSEQNKQALLPHFPQGRLGQPEDAARLIAFLASNAAQWITGQILHSTGGFR